ncbi:MAG: hypothetical protein ACM3O3_12750 [Syntrophothermus sp.]
MRKYIDLTGMVFNKLTVIKQKGSIKSRRIWLCECECGNISLVKTSRLLNGSTKSCGCLRGFNSYNFSLRYGVGYTSKKEFFIFDLEDLCKIKDYCWRYDKDGYLIARKRGTNKFVKMHRLILNADNNMLIDHRNNLRHDNRKNNLRIATNSQNQMNVGIRKNNKSGVTGVRYCKFNKKWHSYISINKKQTTLGYFIDFTEACNARKKAENKYYGEYKNLNYG